VGSDVRHVFWLDTARIRSEITRMPFTKKTTDFLKLAGAQTNPKWLDSHKKEHLEYVQEPLRELAIYLGSKLKTEARGYKFPVRGFGRLRKPQHKIVRGQPAFRDWVKLQAARPSKSLFDTNPGFYFFVSAKECFTGAGHYEPSSRQIKQIRQWIDNDPSSLVKLLKHKHFAGIFPDGLETEKILKTFPRNYAVDHKHIEWLRLQAYYVNATFARKALYSSEFKDLVLESWRQGLRLNNVIEDALSEWNHVAPEDAPEDLASDAALDETSGDLWDDRL
jgi:uncharacterized protein (DUF2461 family)